MLPHVAEYRVLDAASSHLTEARWTAFDSLGLNYGADGALSAQLEGLASIRLSQSRMISLKAMRAVRKRRRPNSFQAMYLVIGSNLRM